MNIKTNKGLNKILYKITLSEKKRNITSSIFLNLIEIRSPQLPSYFLSPRGM
jgi:hypothetical protein